MATQDILGQRTKTKRKSWMTDKILELMEDRRLVKNDKLKYRDIADKLISTKIKNAKQLWIREEAEKLLGLHESFNFHKKVKQICGYHTQSKLRFLEDQNGKLTMDRYKLQETWKNYAEAHFKDIRSENKNN